MARRKKRRTPRRTSGSAAARKITTQIRKLKAKRKALHKQRTKRR